MLPPGLYEATFERAEQSRRVAGIEAQDREIADAVAKLTAKGSAKSAIAATEAQQARRAGIARARLRAARMWPCQPSGPASSG